MQFHVFGAFYAGLIASLAMLVLLYVFLVLRLSPDLPWMVGLIFTGPANLPMVYLLGLTVYMIMGLVFAFGYVWFFSVFRWPLEWYTGPWFGLLHGLMAGSFLGFMPLFHPRMGKGRVLGPPGPFGFRYGRLVPSGILLLHMVYGLVLGAVYGPA